ncbi:MAG: hypothetical protein KI786_01005 [Mameliella sp.]|nr:hypothetical protein [Phaeodactylibacter sp.]
MKNLTLLTLIMASAMFFVACDNDDDEKSPLVIPAAYNGANFGTNASVEGEVRAQLSAFVSKIKEGRDPNVTVSADDLSSLFTSGSPSIESITTSYYAGLVNEWISELSKASGSTYTIGNPTGEGGVVGDYLFDENGLELEQMLDKGLYGAAMYNHAINLIEAGNLTTATVDRLVQIFGAHPDFPNSNNGSSVENPDKFLANYTARRDKADGQGLYTQMKTAFITLQAAIEAGDQYNEERDQALEDLIDTWEKANAATVINYCHQTLSKLSATNLTDEQIGSGLHSYAEAVGFLHGWRTIPSNYKLITDGEIEHLLEKLNAPYDGTPTSYLLVTQAATELPKVQAVIDDLQEIYNFTDQEIEDFKENWVSFQGR